MKKKILLILVTLVLNVTVVNAASCPAKDKADLLSLSSVINANYIEQTGYYTEDQIDDPGDYEANKEQFAYNYFTIDLYNLTENYYVEITNNVNDKVKTVNYDDLKDGLYTFKHGSLNNVTTYTIEVYASGKTSCSGEHLTTKYLVVPKYNQYASLGMCEGNEDKAVCQKYTTSETYTEDSVLAYLRNEKFNSDKDNDKDDDNFVDVLQDNFIYIIIGGFSLIVVILVARVIIKKRSDLK